MVTNRPIERGDEFLLALSLSKDEHHKETDPEFFFQRGCVTNVYEDDKGPVCFVRGSKALRLDIQYVSNDDFERNRDVMLGGFDELCAKAKANGFTEVIFNTTNRQLAVFCKKRFKFKESNGELRRHL